MQAQHSPFGPAVWALPPVPFAMSGDLAWLAAQPAHDEPIAGCPPEQMPALLSACERLGITLPPAFVGFMGSELWRRVRSGSGCYVDLDTAPVASPVGHGYLIRFLNHECCTFWYLHVTPGSTEHSVVVSTDCYDSQESNEDEDGFEPDDGSEPDEIVLCGESFEAFLCRFWLTEEVWYADNEDSAMPDVGEWFIARYREPIGSHLQRSVLGYFAKLRDLETSMALPMRLRQEVGAEEFAGMVRAEFEDQADRVLAVVEFAADPVYDRVALPADWWFMLSPLVDDGHLAPVPDGEVYVDGYLFARQYALADAGSSHLDEHAADYLNPDEFTACGCAAGGSLAEHLRHHVPEGGFDAVARTLRASMAGRVSG